MKSKGVFATRRKRDKPDSKYNAPPNECSTPPAQSRSSCLYSTSQLLSYASIKRIAFGRHLMLNRHQTAPPKPNPWLAQQFQKGTLFYLPAASARYHVKLAPPSIQPESKFGCEKKFHAADGSIMARFA